MHAHVHHRDLPSFPTRRPSDLETDVMVPTTDGSADAALFYPAGKGTWPAVLMWPDILGLRPVFRDMGKRLAAEGYRSEEHTSELQSLRHLVCRLLLEKKKKTDH